MVTGPSEIAPSCWSRRRIRAQSPPLRRPERARAESDAVAERRRCAGRCGSLIALDRVARAHDGAPGRRLRSAMRGRAPAAAARPAGHGRRHACARRRAAGEPPTPSQSIRSQGRVDGLEPGVRGLTTRHNDSGQLQRAGGRRRSARASSQAQLIGVGGVSRRSARRSACPEAPCARRCRRPPGWEHPPGPSARDGSRATAGRPCSISTDPNPTCTRRSSGRGRRLALAGQEQAVAAWTGKLAMKPRPRRRPLPCPRRRPPAA